MLKVNLKTAIHLGATSALMLFALAIAFESSALPAGNAIAFPPGGFVYPLVRPRLASNFGKRKHPIFKAVRHHAGVDLAAPEDTPVRAIRDGVVIFADSYAGYGNLVVIKHSDSLTSHYGHCKTISVQPGTAVKAGRLIATVGSTGKVTGPHLHLELRVDGKPIDPQTVMPDLDGLGEG